MGGNRGGKDAASAETEAGVEAGKPKRRSAAKPYPPWYRNHLIWIFVIPTWVTIGVFAYTQLVDFLRYRQINRIMAEWEAYVTAPLPPPPPVLEPGTPLKPLDQFRDCERCPTMIVIPAGKVLVSDHPTPSRPPNKRITLAKPYAIGKSEITEGDYDACVEAAFCSRPVRRQFSGEIDWVQYPRDWPVRYLPQDQFFRYLKWLSNETGHDYRLPSEAEWLWAARGGKDTAFWWGSEPQENLPQCIRCTGGPIPWWESGNITDRRWVGPVSMYEANPFGLHDVYRGVGEIFGGCYVHNPLELPDDGSAPDFGSCNLGTDIETTRIHYGTPDWYEYAKRHGLNIWKPSRFGLDFWVSDTLGFRVARSLDD